MKPDRASAFVGRGEHDLLVWPVWFKFLAELDGVMTNLPDLRASNFVYLFELVLGDLLIAPAANVSEAPGVEQLLRQ